MPKLIPFHNTYKATGVNDDEAQDIVLIHGWGLHAIVFDDIVPALLERFRVTVVDLPGMGQSPMPNGDYTLDFLADEVLAIMPERAHVLGWSLGGLFALWLAGRVAIGLSMFLPPLAVAVIDLAMPVALGLVIAREIVAGKNWKNLMVLGLLTAFTLANALFHWEAAHGFYAAQGYGLRLGVGAGVMMIAVIGGRVVPSFTRNWLVRRGEGRRDRKRVV